MQWKRCYMTICVRMCVHVWVCACMHRGLEHKALACGRGEKDPVCEPVNGLFVHLERQLAISTN